MLSVKVLILFVLLSSFRTAFTHSFENVPNIIRKFGAFGLLSTPPTLS